MCFHVKRGRRWHNRRLLPFDEFIATLLSAKLGLCLTDTALFVFCGGLDNNNELSVPYTWMTTEEQSFCYRLYVQRTTLFGNVTDFNTHRNQSEHTHQQRYRLCGFLLDEAVVQRAICKRFIVQQFALDCIEYGMSHPSRIHILIALISAVGKRLVAVKGRDEFLLNLKIALEQHNMWSAVNELPVVVKIGTSADALPVYHISKEDLLGFNGNGDNPQSTPYRLV